MLLLLVLGLATASPTINLMTKELLGDFEDEQWAGYSCTFSDWTTCVNSTGCNAKACKLCTSKFNNESIACSMPDSDERL